MFFSCVFYYITALATSIGSGAIKMRRGLILGAAFEFLGCIALGSFVSSTISEKIVDPDEFAFNYDRFAAGMFSALVSASIWLLVATKLQLPVSTTQTAIGGVIGFGLLEQPSSVKAKTLIDIGLSWIISPVLGGVLGFSIYYWINRLILKHRCPEKRSLELLPYVTALTFGVLAGFLATSQWKIFKFDPLIVPACAIVAGLLAYALHHKVIVRKTDKHIAKRIQLTRMRQAAAEKAEHSHHDDSDSDVPSVTIVEEPPPENEDDVEDDEEDEYVIDNVDPDIEIRETLSRPTTADKNGVPHTSSAPPPLETLTGENSDSKQQQQSNSGSTAVLSPSPTHMRAAVIVPPDMPNGDASINDSDCPYDDYSQSNEQHDSVGYIQNDARPKSKTPQIDGDGHVIGVLADAAELELHHDDDLRLAEGHFKALMIVTAAAVAFAHGSNDVANAIGPFTAIVQIAQEGNLTGGVDKPALWILVLGGIGLLVGLLSLGHLVIETVGSSITKLTYTRGFSAQLGAALTVLIASFLGLPVSTSSILVGAITGITFVKDYNIENAIKLEEKEKHDPNAAAAATDDNDDGTPKKAGARVNSALLFKIVCSWFATVALGGLASMGMYAAISTKA
jgi:solute carrier family 20 (sodium-dependent phosphate transporter)